MKHNKVKKEQNKHRKKRGGPYRRGWSLTANRQNIEISTLSSDLSKITTWEGQNYLKHPKLCTHTGMHTYNNNTFTETHTHTHAFGHTMRQTKIHAYLPTAIQEGLLGVVYSILLQGCRIPKTPVGNSEEISQSLSYLSDQVGMGCGWKGLVRVERKERQQSSAGHIQTHCPKERFTEFCGEENAVCGLSKHRQDNEVTHGEHREPAIFE